MTKVTAMTIHVTGEGTRAAYTYSVIDDDGQITSQNQRGSLILVDETASAAADTLFAFLQEKAEAAENAGAETETEETTEE